ncbi:MAG: hypothetical protein ACK5MP_12815 [Nostocoides sp.]
MSVLERRLQLLLDMDRYERVAREAQLSGRSVNAVIREAIDLRFPAQREARHAALGEFLALIATSPAETEDWTDLKDAMAHDTDEHLPR